MKKFKHTNTGAGMLSFQDSKGVTYNCGPGVSILLDIEVPGNGVLIEEIKENRNKKKEVDE